VGVKKGVIYPVPDDRRSSLRATHAAASHCDAFVTSTDICSILQYQNVAPLFFFFSLMTDKLNQETSWAPRLVMGFRMPPPRCLHVARTVFIQYGAAGICTEITVSDLDGRAFPRHAVGIPPLLLLLQAVAFCIYSTSPAEVAQVIHGDTATPV
jgi:hypothetical protein